MSKRPRLFAGYFLEWIETYKVGAIRDISVSKYYIAHKHLTEICPDLTIDKLDRKAYQSILNEYALTHERQTTMDFHHQIGSCVRDMYHEGLIKRDPTYKAIIKGIPPRPKKEKIPAKRRTTKAVEITRTWRRDKYGLVHFTGCKNRNALCGSHCVNTS